jgi:hypothetical protein
MQPQRVGVAVVAMLLVTHAGSFWPSGLPFTEPIPLWSRLHWSIGVGTAALSEEQRRVTSAVVTPALGFGLWGNERTCSRRRAVCCLRRAG